MPRDRLSLICGSAGSAEGEALSSWVVSRSLSLVIDFGKLSPSQESSTSTHSSGVRPQPLVSTGLLCQNATSKGSQGKETHVHNPRLLTVSGPATQVSPGGLIEMQNLRPPALLKQNLHFNKLPR